MRKWHLVAGVLLTVAVACQAPAAQKGAATKATLTPSAMASATSPPLLPATARPQPRSSPTPRPAATAAPWQSAGGPAWGFSLSVPPAWQDFSPLLAAANGGDGAGRLLLWADQEAVAQALLEAPGPQDPALERAAFAGTFVLAGLLPAGVAPAPDAEAALAALLDQDGASGVPQTTVVAGVPGAYADISGAYARLGGRLIDVEAPRRLRLLVLLPQGTETPLLFQFGAPAGRWQQRAPLVARMMDSITVHDLQLARLLPAQEPVMVRGPLHSGDARQERLRSGHVEAWTFTAGSGQYLALQAGPAGTEPLDLNLTLLDPSGRPLLVADNGFAGDRETITDLALEESGRYLLLVRELQQRPGPYQILIDLTAGPQFGSGGTMRLNEALYSRLQAGTSQRWRFAGSGGQPVNIVVTPRTERLDPILELLDPTGEVVISLDEGFSGDAEVISNLTLPISGEYTIRIYEFSRTGSSGGPYVLSLSEGAEQTANFHDAGDLLYGTGRRETLRPDEVHAWFLEGLAGDTITLSAIPRDRERALNLDLWLLSPSLERLVARDSHPPGQAETLTHTLPVTGQYVVLVREFEGFPGDYEVQLAYGGNQVLTRGPALAYGDAVTQTVAPDAPAALPFRGEAGEMITAQVEPLDGRDLVLILRDPAGNLVFSVNEKTSGEAEQLPAFILARPGEWQLIVREAHNRQSEFALSLRRLDQDP